MALSVPKATFAPDSISVLSGGTIPKNRFDSGGRPRWARWHLRRRPCLPPFRHGHVHDEAGLQVQYLTHVLPDPFRSVDGETGTLLVHMFRQEARSAHSPSRRWRDGNAVRHPQQRVDLPMKRTSGSRRPGHDVRFRAVAPGSGQSLGSLSPPRGNRCSWDAPGEHVPENSDHGGGQMVQWHVLSRIRCFSPFGRGHQIFQRSRVSTGTTCRRCGCGN